jgi:hypothetical protein
MFIQNGRAFGLVGIFFLAKTPEIAKEKALP